MQSTIKIPGSTILKGTVMFLSASFILCYLYVVYKRLFYPYELEWLEGYFLAAAARITSGTSIYPPPTPEFIPLLYPPLYYYLIGGLAKITGVNFWGGRLISICASLLSGFIIYRCTQKETKSTFCAFFTVGLFFASYALTDAWFDVARVDSLFLALSLSGIYLVRYHSFSSAHIICAALVLSLAFFTKQAALFFLISCTVYLWFAHKGKCLLLLLSSALLIGGGIIVLNHLTDGWYWFHTFTVPLQHYSYSKHEYHRLLTAMYKQYTPLAQEDYGSIKMLVNFFKRDLLGTIPVIVLLVSGWALYEIKTVGRGCSSFFWTLVLFSALAASITMRTKFGGHVNTLIPTIAVLLIFFGIAAGHILKEKKQSLLTMLVYLAILVQFITMAYNPMKQIPTAADYHAGKRLIDLVSSFAGDVYMPFHSFYPVMAGKQMYAHKMPIEDIYIGFPQLLPEGLFEKIAHQGFSAIIYDWEIDDHTGNPLERAIIQHYRTSIHIPYQDETVFLPLSGLKVRPLIIYVPKK